VELGEQVERGPITREDTAAVLAAALHEPRLVGRTFVAVGGAKPLSDALARLIG
jgi:hypothetical protein